MKEDYVPGSSIYDQERSKNNYCLILQLGKQNSELLFWKLILSRPANLFSRIKVSYKRAIVLRASW